MTDGKNEKFSWTDLLEIGAFDGDGLSREQPSYIWTATAFLKRFRDYPTETTTELMPNHGRWVRAVRRIYDRADETDRAVMMGEECPDLNRAERNRRFLLLCYALAVESGTVSRYGTIFPRKEDDENGKREDISRDQEGKRT